MLIEKILLLTAFASAFYHIGVDVVTERETYPGWSLLTHDNFRKLRLAHLRNLFIFFFLPGIIEIVCILILLVLNPTMEVIILLSVSLLLLLVNFGSSALVFAKWQQRISEEDHGPESILMQKILQTNWIRTTIVTLNGFIWFMVVLISN